MKIRYSNVVIRVFVILITLSLLFVSAACGQTGTGTEAPGQTTTAEPPDDSGSDEPVTLAMITWAQQSNIDAIEGVNDAFKDVYSNVSIVIDSVSSDDYSTLEQTRVAAGDVDIITGFSFDGIVRDYMVGVDAPSWQQYVEAGTYLDITDEPFVQNWDPAMIEDAASHEGRVYGINVGKVAISGMYYNKDIFTEYGLSEPQTWDDLEEILVTLDAAGVTPLTGAAQDGWPINMMAHGFIGSSEEDIEAYLEGLWTGERQFTDEGSMKIWNRIETWSKYFERGVAGIDYASAPGRFAAGTAAMMPDGSWNSGTIEAAGPDFEFGYFTIPGDRAGNPNQLIGKYDLQFHIYAQSPNKDWGLKWLAFLSEKENYTPFINALSMFPTMHGVEISNEFIASLDDKNQEFQIAFERIFKAPRGVGQYGDGFQITQLEVFGGSIATVEELAQLQQADWDEAMAAVVAGD